MTDLLYFSDFLKKKNATQCNALFVSVVELNGVTDEERSAEGKL